MVRRRRGAAQICVWHNDSLVIDETFGCGDDALFWTFSAGKPFLAIAVHRLAEQGALSLDDPISKHWPEFGGHGKAAITLRQVLQHRAGLPTAGTGVGDALAMANWAQSIDRIKRARPRYPPGTVPAYGFVSYGFILGEVLRRITGTPVPAVLQEQVFGLVGMADTYLGLPAEQLARMVPIRAAGAVGRALMVVVNRPVTRQAVIPAAGYSLTARDLALFYANLLRCSAPGHGTLLAPATLAAACSPSSDGVTDRFSRAPIRWSQGFQLGGPRWESGAITPLGRSSSPRAFGHNGSNCCIGWADPDRHLAFGYVTDWVGNAQSDTAHLADVADVVLAAFSPWGPPPTPPAV
jgi:CubicO group peptidase (beta-lactamase class C family)